MRLLSPIIWWLKMNKPSNDVFVKLLTRFTRDEPFRRELCDTDASAKIRAGLSQEEGRQLDQILAVYTRNRSSMKGLAFPLNTKLGTYLTARR